MYSQPQKVIKTVLRLKVERKIKKQIVKRRTKLWQRIGRLEKQ